MSDPLQTEATPPEGQLINNGTVAAQSQPRSSPGITPRLSPPTTPSMPAKGRSEPLRPPSIPEMNATNAMHIPNATKSFPAPVDQALTLSQYNLPSPRDPSKCPLLCCFFAEFDNVVGPKVCFQSPRHFMEQDISISTELIHQILADTFQVIQPKKTKGTDNSYTTQDRNRAPQDATRNAAKKYSIFRSTSEYIITGNELAGKMIGVSTHNMHILTRPTIITNKKYERNTMFFCVGFVLRRTEDPTPFRPLLSKWATALRSMEVESQFLTNEHLRQQLQPMLDRLLLSLNSKRGECNILLDSANVLNLKLFRPPKPLATPVQDHFVPILLRKNWQIQNCDWDLAINWVIMHIDGINHARWISAKSEVDMEMVRACLRVLKHHGVVGLVDMFFYSNRYECTERAADMLCGNEPKLLQNAFDFAAKHENSNVGIPQTAPSESPNHCEVQPSHRVSHGSNQTKSVSPFATSYLSPFCNSLPSTGKGSSHKMSPPVASQENCKSPTFRHEQNSMKAALAEMYCLCNRRTSIGDLWVAKTTKAEKESHSRKERDENGPLGDNYDHIQGNQQLQWKGSRSLESNLDRGRSLPHIFPEPSEVHPISNDNKDGEQKQSQSPVDWKAAFQYFDHRRFTSFGIINGILRRVHNFPLAYNANENISSALDDVRHCPNFDDGYGNTSVRSVGSAPASQKKGNSQEDPNTIASRIALSMDGTRCDDELVCMFEMPIEKLIGAVQTAGEKRVMSLYLTAGPSELS